MAVDKNLEPFEVEEGGNPEESELKVEIVNPDAVSIGTDDGGMVIDFEGSATEELVGPDHNSNLAEFIEDSDLEEMASDLVEDFDSDRTSRKEWSRSYVKGLDLLGMKIEERTQPWEGASGVFHPLLSEAIVRFQAQAMGEIFPAAGPVRTKVVGKQTKEKNEQSKRVEHEMNYMLTEEMTEYRDEMEQMLFRLPLAGSAFKKVYYDPTRQRAVSKFIPAQDLVVPYSASDLTTANRVTHVLRMDENEVRKMQVAGMYRDVDLKSSDDIEEDPVRQKVNELEGLSKNYSEDVLTILEIHADLDIEGFEDIDMATGEPTGIRLPYIVTIDHTSGQILSIRRNYSMDDPLRRKRPYFVHYKFTPGLGFYGFGLIHMIGGLGRAATSLLRQLIDAGTLANLPAGFKARGVRVRNSDEPLQPGEWRDIDAPGGSIRDAIVPLPYKEPSGTLAQMLGGLVNDGRRFIALADQSISDMGQETPVGTTVAMLERGMKVMSAIHKRLHYAQKTEFRLLARIFAENLPPMYPYEVMGAPQQVKVEDFDARIDVLPVSDPNIFSMAQRVTLAQTQLQLAQSNPQMHNLHAAYRRMYQALEVQNIDEILPPPPPPPPPQDPAVENGSMINGQTPQASPEQDHDAHIQAHLSLLDLSVLQTAPPVLAAVFSHIFQHISMKAREMVDAEIQALSEENMMQQETAMQQQNQQLQLMVQAGAINPASAQQMAAQQMQQQAPPQQFTPEQIEARVAQIEAELTKELVPMLSAKSEADEKDPLVDIRMQELAIKEAEAEHKLALDQAKLELEGMKIEQRAVTDAARLELQEQIADDRSDVNRERIDVQRQAAEKKAD